MHAGWQVLVTGDRIAAVGREDRRTGGRPGASSSGVRHCCPGLIEGHGHLFLHPYNETSWDDQVLHESLALRTARAVTPRTRRRCGPGSPPSGISAPKAQAMPTWGSSRRSSRASCPDPGCWSRRAPSSRPAPTVPRVSSPASRCPQGAEEATPAITFNTTPTGGVKNQSRY